VTTLSIDHVSRWFGNVVAVNDITMTIGPGVTGLLGPNGAGKSTLINMMGGFLAPSTGTVTLDGQPVWRNERIYEHIGIVPEREAMYDFLTGREFVVANAELHGLGDKAAQRALATVEMEYAQDRRIATYSKGMRQRVKMASALVHDPSLLLLDEPFNGMDPRQRMQLMDLLRRMGDEGRTVLFSSHILEEVEQLARPRGRADRRPVHLRHRGRPRRGRAARPGRRLRPLHHPAAEGRQGPRHPAAHGLAVGRVPGVRLLVPGRGVGGRRCTTPPSPGSPTGPCSAVAGPSSSARCRCCSS
jgi:ABC-type Na+ transport system ATPase subunit NatA